MGRRRKGGGPRPVKGFRPGKEPPALRKQRARAQLGKDASWAQRRMVEALGERRPEEVRAIVTKWTRGLLGGAVFAAIVGVLLYWWSVPAGVITHVVTVVLAVLWWRIRRQAESWVTIAESWDTRRRR